MGSQTLSTKPTAPQTRFGSGKRTELATKTAAPGPGAYKLKSTIGASYPLNTHAKPGCWCWLQFTSHVLLTSLVTGVVLHGCCWLAGT